MATDQSASRALPPIRASCHAAGVAGRIPVVVDPRCADHDPQAEIWLGVRTPATEVADRVTLIESTLRELGHEVVPAREFDDAWLSRVHSAELLDHLATVWDRWVDGGYPDLGAQRVVPYLFPSAELLHGLPASAARRTACPGRRVLLRHDDARRPGQLASDQGRHPRRPAPQSDLVASGSPAPPTR